MIWVKPKQFLRYSIPTDSIVSYPFITHRIVTKIHRNHRNSKHK